MSTATNDEWQNCRLGDVVTLKRGYDLAKHQREPGDYPVISSAGLVDYHAHSKVKGPGVVTGRTGTLGEVFYIDDDFWPHNTTLYVQDFKGNYPKFVYYLLQWIGLARRNAASAVPTVNRNVLHILPVKLPPYAIQVKISSILDEVKLTLLEQQKIIEGYVLLKKGLMQRLLTRGIGHTRFKKTKIGDIPESWELVELGDETVTTLIGGTTPSRAEPSFWNGTIAWATPTDVTALDTIEIEKTKDTVSQSGLESSRLRILPPGSVLMTSRATIGFCAINTIPMTTNQGFASFICHEKIQNKFLLYLLTFMKAKFIRYANGSTFKELTRTTLRKFLIPLPSLGEQHQISEILFNVDKCILVEKQCIQRIECLKKGLMQVLLTGKVRVKV